MQCYSQMGFFPDKRINGCEAVVNVTYNNKRMAWFSIVWQYDGAGG